MEFVEALHVSVLEAYMALVQAYRDQPAQVDVLRPFMGDVMEFICRVSGAGGEVDEAVVRSAACLVGCVGGWRVCRRRLVPYLTGPTPGPHPSDVCHAFGAATKPYLLRPETQQVLKLFEELVREAGNDRQKEQLAWLQQQYNKIITAA